ncbi:DUF6183 family protein [Dermatobacter hominis]|uniref:DUF6183 family protein n=1 Tax=Dermatobacter hominis TaxID=2884263 RepID=UPI001D12A768|nr:DUF6183 family protein [Dermatobacter hominis]UDY37245.1 DUF6183 family protein [Dermatobacter hominis]
MTVPEPAPRQDPELDRWITTGDLDELLREVDRRCDRGDWDGVVLLRDRARAATERGHQLWPAATFAEYRMALSAPPPWAAGVVEGGYLAPGPLTEVVAQDHTFAELADELPLGPARDQVAQERVLRGEVLAEDRRADGPATGLPGRLLAWEPGYRLAEYRPNGDARFPGPDPVRTTGPVPQRDGTTESADAADGARALADAVRHWRSHSEGSIRSSGVEGTAAGAVDAMVDGPATWAPVGLAEAVELLAWAAASGGARGRRRGAATGRFDAWWVLAVLTAQDDDWPVDPGPAAGELRWWVWEPGAAERLGSAPGWSCRLAVEDPVDGLAWALDATDRTPT